MSDTRSRYNKLNEYLKKIFGERTLKICIDAGFSCPNRDGTCGTDGCIFCGERGSGENTKGALSIKNQVLSHLDSYRGKRANKFIAYFQNFSNTYGDVNVLKERYDEALVDDRIVALAVATRPDCINEDVAKLLSEYKKKYHVFVELGFQTSNDATGFFINRGYDSKTFVDAVNLLDKYGLEVIAHVMVGLPGESKDDVLNTVKFLNKTKISGIKFHSTYVIKDTKLAKLFESGEYIPLELDVYIDTVVDAIGILRKDIIVHRISGDAPKDLLIAPKWNLHKKWIMNGIEKELKNRNVWQGKFLE